MFATWNHIVTMVLLGINSHWCVDVWKIMTSCLELRECRRLLLKTVQLSISIRWPATAGKDWEPRSFDSSHLSLKSSISWMLLVVSICLPISETWRVEVEQSCQLCPFPTRRHPPPRRQLRTAEGARMAPSWTPSGFFYRVFSLWWLSAR